MKDNKENRAPINQKENINKLSDDDKIRMAMGKHKKLDATYYQSLPEYQGMSWRWENDDKVDQYLDIGMQLTPRRADRTGNRQINNDLSEWECRSVGNGMKAYLLHMPSSDYKKYFTDPKAARRADLERAMTGGKADDDGVGAGLQTYGGKIGDHNPIR